MDQSSLKESEKLTGHLYGVGFSAQSDQDFKKVIEPLAERFQKNNIPLEIFKDKVCLDAGCGGGRGTVFMLQNGAREVFSVDIDQKLIDYATARVQELGFQNAHISLNSILDLPFEDGTFDIVFCNGVIHRTDNPDRALQELARVLKPGGSLFLYTLGAGGINYHLMDWIRKVLAGVDIEKSVKYLDLIEPNPLKSGSYLDDWFMPMFRRYKAEDVKARLESLGFENCDVLKYGTVYDTSQRKNTGERDIMGEGDLRYFCKKIGNRDEAAPTLPDVAGTGSLYDYPTAFEALNKKYEQIEKLLEAKFRGDLVMKLLAVRSLQDKVRDLLKQQGSFDLPAYSAHIDKAISQLEGF